MLTREMILAAEQAEIDWQEQRNASDSVSMTDARKDRLRFTLLAALAASRERAAALPPTEAVVERAMQSVLGELIREGVHAGYGQKLTELAYACADAALRAAAPQQEERTPHD